MRLTTAPQQAITIDDTNPAQTIQRLEEENRWLKSYLGETLKELHLLQMRLAGKMH